MPSCCRTCDHRNHAIHTSTPTLLDVCLISLTFRAPITSNQTSTAPYIGLNSLLNDITDAADSTSHPTTFTTWSHCLLNPSSVIILTTASETCSSASSPVFEALSKHLAQPPSVQHILLDYSIISLAASSPEARTPCDIITLSAPTPGIASAIGKRFGWDPKRSSLSAQIGSGTGAAFSHPGDLTRDFWAWAELQSQHNDPSSPSGSLGSVGSDYEVANPEVLRSMNSDEKNMALFYPEDEGTDEESVIGKNDDETLVMLFQWNSHADAERFKHPLQKSVGRNGDGVSPDLWDRHVAHPVRQLEGIGAKVEKFRLDLRGVEPRLETSKGRLAVRERSGSRRLSVIAAGLGERVTGFWK
ncbi:hypothetical protein K491DRAFT_700525 [Lophiostoma macrostomum CBS 122681]|uniref:Uncharacterized protein n=1 Tax=Lophiostoma macrostomum CBS 122681 TaxID=1314788 RepID=A0A6A6TTK6_9PLEO|nr:hypothetical protein K491DRAFT_700525 [Lophiostoma macrostomum CBS 122681]